MILKMYAVFDSATEMYGRPFFMVADGQAMRSFKDQVNAKDATNELSNHPDDFTLFALGDFDDNTGRFRVLDVPSSLVRGKDIRLLSES